MKTYKIRLFRNVIFCLLLSILCIVTSCERQIELDPINSEEKTFLYVYGEDNQYNHSITKENDGYILTGGGEDFNRLISKIDYTGKIIWEVPLNTSNSSFLNKGTRLNNGSSVYINKVGNSDVTLVDQDGVLVYTKGIISSSMYNFSPVLEGNDGELYYSYIVTDLEGFSRVVRFNTSNGDSLDEYIYRNNQFGPSNNRVTQFNVYHSSGNQLWVVGDMYYYENGSNSWKHNTFVNKIIKSNYNVGNVVTLNGDDKELCAFTSTTNQQLIAITAKKNPEIYTRNTSNKYFDVNRVDSNLNVLWTKRIELPVDEIEPRNVCENKHGDIVVVGNCIASERNYSSSFAVRVSRDGDLLGHRIFDLNKKFILLDVAADNDYYVFAGFSNGFGKGTEGNKRIILKTDKEFKY